MSGRDQLKKLKEQRFDYKPVEIVLNKDIKEVTSEEEYDRIHTIYLKRIKKLNNVKNMIYKPDEYLKEFEIILTEMVAYGIITLEFANNKRQKLYDTLNYPSKFRNWVIKKIDRLRKKK